MSIHEMLTATSLGASGRFPGSTWVSTHGTETESPVTRSLPLLSVAADLCAPGPAIGGG
jgi:hypothetical protein